MTTAIKFQLSVFGNRIREALSERSTIEIGDSQNDDSAIRTYSLSQDAVLPPDALLSTSATDCEDLPKYSLCEVLEHDSAIDCWVVVYDRVYDLTNFLQDHPGGDEIILEYAGRDATFAFRSSGHSKMAEAALEPYLVGILQEKDRLWAQLWGIRWGSR